MAQEITDAQFEQEVLKSSIPVLVDFWAPWCGPCRILGPIVEELVAENAGKPIKIAKMNIDENTTAASQYNVMSIPTMMFFKDGKPVEQLVGVQDKTTLQAKIDELTK
ncbi:MAG TPA: thioredoxin [Patescibacteria group bacterium]|nr:thioredoxin [Patescibacteria group bacterium]